MTVNSPLVARNNSEGVTLRQLIDTAMQVLPLQRLILKQVLQQAQDIEAKAECTTLLDSTFAQFVLDSRQFSKEQAANKNVKDAFVLLKSHTQPIEKSQQYAKAASQQAVFILSEIGASELGYSTDSSEYGCPVLFAPHIRSILGTLIQLSLLPPGRLKNIKTSDDLDRYLPQVIAVTGTNGKTTISQLIAQLCRLSDVPELYNSAVMGTAGNGRLDSLVQATHTTGDASAVQHFLRQMSDEGVDILALEASSHGLDQQRLQGVPVTVAVYSNLSRDHLDYHPDMQDYARAKARLFDSTYFPKLTHAIINADDEFAPLMIETAAKSGVKVWVYSLNPNFYAESTLSQAHIDATFIAKDIKPSLEGVQVELASSFGTITLNSPLLGHFNVANLLAAVGGGMALGIRLEAMPILVSQLQGASGRMQRVTVESNEASTVSTANHGVFIVDYAHTPDALTQVLNSLKPHCSGELWAVFGCGGDRDRGKRPLMAQAGLSIADKVILTSDNPRSEDPLLILEDMMEGINDQQSAKATVIADRREAINHAVQHAGDEDIVVIAGKGHETYQEIKGVRYDFDDRQVLQEALKKTEIDKG